MDRCSSCLAALAASPQLLPGWAAAAAGEGRGRSAPSLRSCQGKQWLAPYPWLSAQHTHHGTLRKPPRLAGAGRAGGGILGCGQSLWAARPCSPLHGVAKQLTGVTIPARAPGLRAASADLTHKVWATRARWALGHRTSPRQPRLSSEQLTAPSGRGHQPTHQQPRAQAGAALVCG